MLLYLTILQFFCKVYDRIITFITLFEGRKDEKYPQGIRC